jgi:membrane-bound serine protease (ClpP class)
MTWRQRVLSAIAHPNIAYLLLSLGMLGLTIELWSPGAIVPGVVGGVSLLLAFFALQLLPVNYAGLLLLALGLLLLGLEIKVTSYGLLTVGGAVSLIFGSMILVDSPSPGLQLSLRFVVPVVVAFVSLSAVLVRLGLAAQRQAPVSGAEGMIGRSGRALTPLEPGLVGTVAVHGEIWQARSDDRVLVNDPVRIVGIDGLLLSVHKD